MILTGQKIIEEMAAGNIVITPFELDQINPNSYDLRLGSVVKEVDYKLNPETLEFEEVYKPLPTFKIPGREGEFFYIEKGKCYLASTLEHTITRKHVPCIQGKSSIARKFINVHQTAGFGDVGFSGHWTLEITSEFGDTWLQVGQRVCQIYYQEVSGDLTFYNGKYNNDNPNDVEPK